jgi:hypothetical protein
VFAHLLGRETEGGMTPHSDDVLVVHAMFHVCNTSSDRTMGHLWLHFGNTSQLRLGYKVARGSKLSGAIPHQFVPPFGILGDAVRYVIPSPPKGTTLASEGGPTEGLGMRLTVSSSGRYR